MAPAARSLAVSALVASLSGALTAQAQDAPPARPVPAEPATPGSIPVAAPFLIISQERLLTGSEPGRRLLANEERQRDAMRTEARALDAAFEAEERKLTDERPTLDPVEFRRQSDAFDARVVKARRDQDSRSAALAQEFDQQRRQFYARVAPILVMLMDRYQARAVLDENSVLLADQSLNITQAVIAEIDARLAQEPETPSGDADQATPPQPPPAAETDGGE